MRFQSTKSILRVARGIGAIGVLLAFGCDDSSGPDDSPAGAYHATSLVSTESGQSTNHIANGSTIDLTLTSQGTTSGLFHIVTSAAGPGLDANLAGTWTINGSTVELDGSADTFMRDMEFTYNGNTLVGDETFSGTRIQLTLTRN